MKQFFQARTINLFLTIFCPTILILIIRPELFAVTVALNALQYLLLLGYFYFLASALRNKLIPGISISNTLFNVCLGIAFILLCLKDFAKYLPADQQDNLAIFIPLALVAIFIFYIYIHLGHLLASVEREENVPFKKHIFESLLFLFFGLGIWALQPRIRNIFSEPKAPRAES